MLLTLPRIMIIIKMEYTVLKLHIIMNSELAYENNWSILNKIKIQVKKNYRVRINYHIANLSGNPIIYRFHDLREFSVWWIINSTSPPPPPKEINKELWRNNGYYITVTFAKWLLTALAQTLANRSVRRICSPRLKPYWNWWPGVKGQGHSDVISIFSS